MKEEERCSDDDGGGGDGDGDGVGRSYSSAGVIVVAGRLDRRHRDMELRMISITAKERFPRVVLLLTVRMEVTLAKRGLQAVRLLREIIKTRRHIQ
jgi:hypothetical protein